MEWLKQWQLPITSAYKEQTIRPGLLPLLVPHLQTFALALPLSTCRSIGNDIAWSNSLEQGLIKPQPHTSVAFNLLFSPLRLRAGEDERKAMLTFLCINEENLHGSQLCIKFVLLQDQIALKQKINNDLMHSPFNPAVTL